MSKKKSVFSEIEKYASETMYAIGESLGLDKFAAMAVEAEEAAIKRLVALARAHKVSEKSIARALTSFDRVKKIQDLVTILFPFVPGPSIVRVLAGKSAGKKEASATKRPASKSKRKGRRS